MNNIWHKIYTSTNNNMAAGKMAESLAAYVLLCDLRFYVGFVFLRYLP